MRGFTCSCGAIIEADDDEALLKAAREHCDEVHTEMQLTDAQIRSLITAKGHDE